MLRVVFLMIDPFVRVYNYLLFLLLSNPCPTFLFNSFKRKDMEDKWDVSV